MKPYAVEVSFTMIVMAEDEDDAYAVAEEWADEAWGDTSSGSKDFHVDGLVRNDADLKRYKWDGQCLPYGGDGGIRLSDILAALDAEPERDTKTIDMFEGA
jgi:hypothetical protein